MTRKTEEELKALIVQFYALDPSDEQIETFYGNEILPHDKRSIVELMTLHSIGYSGLLYKEMSDSCYNCGFDVTQLLPKDINSWPQCTSVWFTFFNGKEMPEGFENTTYGNDATPSIAHKSGRVYVWFYDEFTWQDIGWDDPMVKYQVVTHHREQVYGETWDDCVNTNTNDWDEVLKAIETWRKTARKKVEVKSPDSGEYLELFAFDEWGTYQAVSTLFDEPELYYAPMNKDGTPDTENIGVTEYFDDSDNSNFLETINDFFGTEFTTNDFPLMRNETDEAYEIEEWHRKDGE